MSTLKTPKGYKSSFEYKPNDSWTYLTQGQSTTLPAGAVLIKTPNNARHSYRLAADATLTGPAAYIHTQSPKATVFSIANVGATLLYALLLAMVGFSAADLFSQPLAALTWTDLPFILFGIFFIGLGVTGVYAHINPTYRPIEATLYKTDWTPEDITPSQDTNPTGASPQVTT